MPTTVTTPGDLTPLVQRLDGHDARHDAQDIVAQQHGAALVSLADRVSALEQAPAPEPPPEPEPEPEPPPSGDGPAFLSLFTGADYTDGGRWSRVAGNSDGVGYLQVVVDASAPGGRCLRLRGSNGDAFWQVLRAQGVPTPAVGDTITWRWYYKPVQMDGDGDYHPIDWGTALLNSSPNFAVLKFVKWNGLWQPQIQLTGGRPWYATSQPILQEGTWYRFEVAFTRTGSSTWKPDYRIFEGTQQIVSAADMLGNFGSEPGNTLAGLVSFSNSSAARSAMMEIGSAGVGGMSSNPHETERYAAIAAFVGAPAVNVPFDAARGW